MRAGEYPVIDTAVIHLSASVGVAMLSNTADEGELSRLDVPLRDSDAAMLVAKRSGKNRLYQLPPPVDLAALSPLARASQIRRPLQHALAADGLDLQFQPKFDIKTGLLQAVEALGRWTDDHLGVAAPDEFIPIAEQSGQIIRLGEWVLRRACRQSRRWAMQGEPKVIAINVSPVQLRSPSYVDDVLAVIAECRVTPVDLRIEVTESSAVADLPTVIGQLARLRDAGFAVDLDDFGTGWSSLAVLRNLPLSSVKIDKHFVDKIEFSQADEYLVRGVIQTAHALGLAVTAEGVERASQLRRLSLLGCDSVQGYLTGRPVPATAARQHWNGADGSETTDGLEDEDTVGVEATA